MMEVKETILTRCQLNSCEGEVVGNTLPEGV